MRIDQLPFASSVTNGNTLPVNVSGTTEQVTIGNLVNSIRDDVYGAPLTAATAAAMTDQTKIYVYTGTTGGGFTNGHWYYYNGTAWTDGGVYNSAAVQTDTTLSLSGVPADAKAVGDAISATNANVSANATAIEENAGNIATNTTNISNLTTRVSADEAAIAPTFSASTAYAAGAYVWYNGNLYRFTAAHAAGAWTGTDAAQVALAGDIADLKSALNKSNINVSRLFIYEQPDISADSGLLPLHVETGDSITIRRTDGEAFTNTDQLRLYDKDGTYIDYWGTPVGLNSRTFTYTSQATAEYIGITLISANTPRFYVVNSSSKSSILAEINARKNADQVMDNRISILDSQSAKTKIVNRFSKETITAGKYININTGGLVTNESFFASDFIYIGDLASVTVSYTHLFVWYDENKNHLTPNPDPMNSGNNDLSFTRPEGAMYLRFSAYNANLNLAQVGESVSRNNYVPFGVYNLPELRVSQSQIDTSGDSRVVVDASGGGDYTSFTQAIYDTVDSGIDVLVKPGTYDIVAEYIALFGQTAVDNMADSDSSTFNGFQYGVRLRKRKIEFAPGAHLVCDWTGHTVDGTHRFSALGVDYDVEIIGLDLDVTGTFYCIHDDYGIATPYTVKYDNCRVIGHSITNANCIGGGCKKYSRHILNNCYFDNNLTGSATVRYHNTNAEGAEPEIYVSNCYFNNWFTPRWYGAQTSKMRVYVNNCHARAIYKVAESSSYDVDNVDLYKWNNEETDPQT